MGVGRQPGDVDFALGRGTNPLAPGLYGRRNASVALDEVEWVVY